MRTLDGMLALRLMALKVKSECRVQIITESVLCCFACMSFGEKKKKKTKLSLFKIFSHFKQGGNVTNVQGITGSETEKEN